MSEMTSSQAISQVKRFSKFIRAFENLSETAEFLSQAENLVREADKRRHKIDSETQQATDDLGAIQRQIIEAKDQAAAAIHEAEKRAEGIATAARSVADTIVAGATQESEQVLEGLATVRAELEEATAALNGINTKYASISKKMADVRKEFRAFMAEGG